MRISSATIDCWLYINGNNYSDFQHHHWDVMPSGTIDTANNNTPTYTWALSGFGSDGNGSWNAISQSKTLSNGARVRISSPNTVSLTQTVGFGVNQLTATGSTNATTHPVPELIWPMDLTWNPNLATPSLSTYRDMGQPTIQSGPPAAVPSNPPTFPPTLVLIETFVLAPGVGGRDYTAETKNNFQKPSNATARAWWAWTINLVA